MGRKKYYTIKLGMWRGSASAQRETIHSAFLHQEPGKPSGGGNTQFNLERWLLYFRWNMTSIYKGGKGISKKLVLETTDALWSSTIVL